jgi:hypothetical protein
MFQLISDLKAERDELSKDIEGWRVRVSDLDKQVGMLARRIEIERREAWVARERSGLLEIEKKGLENAFAAKSVEVREALENCKAAMAECHDVKQECEWLREELQRMQEIEDECERAKSALAEEQKRREELEAAVLAAKSTDVIVVDDPPAYSRGKRTLGFPSIDSEATDVGSVDEFQSSLKSVAEEGEELSDEETNELSGYEDEDDTTFQSRQGSSVSSLEEVVQSATFGIDKPAAPTSFSVSDSLTSDVVAGHTRRGSLVKAWTFATGTLASRRETEVDKFFGCLEDSDDSVSLEDTACIDIHGDSGRTLFSQSLSGDDDDFPPFLLPKHVGFEILEERLLLDPVLEEDEEDELDRDDDTLQDDFLGEVVEGGIVFKFTPPEDLDVSSEVQTPRPGPLKQNSRVFETLRDDKDENIVPFKPPHMAAPLTTPPKPLIAQSTAAKVDDSSTIFQTPIRKSTTTSSPSSIPRSVSLRTYTPTQSTSERCVITRKPFNATPPDKREGTIPTSIPQPRVRGVSSVTPLNARPALHRGSTVPVPTKYASQSPVPSSSMQPTQDPPLTDTMIAARQ